MSIVSNEIYPRVVKLLEKNPAADEMTKIRHAMALQLSLKLDEAVADNTGISAQATPGISKELRSVLEEIAATENAKEKFVADIFSE